MKLLGFSAIALLACSAECSADQGAKQAKAENGQVVAHPDLAPGRSLATVAASSSQTLPDRAVKAIEDHPSDAAKCNDGGKQIDCTVVATKATVDQVTYARWNFWVSIFTLIGLGVTLFFNFRALKVADDASADTARSIEIAERNAGAAASLALIAEQNAQREGRAFLSISNFSWLINIAQIRVTMQNFGRTPAYDTQLEMQISGGGAHGLNSLGSFGVVDPGQECIHFTPINGSLGEGMIAYLVAGGEWNAVIRHSYRDAFGKSWVREAVYLLKTTNHRDGVVQQFYLAPGTSHESQS